jgi:fumarylacetoacetate (FAA) hydrolase
VRIEMTGADGRSIFGAIEQEVVRSAHRPAVPAPPAGEG